MKASGKNRFRAGLAAHVMLLAAGAAHASGDAPPAPLAAPPLADEVPDPAQQAVPGQAPGLAQPPVADQAQAAVAQPPVPDQAPGVAARPATPGAGDGRPYKSYGAAALEIAGFQFLLNRFDNRFEGRDYDVGIGSIRRNLHSSWVEDRDPFEINQMGHPYQGSVYFGVARSNGLTFWESMGVAFAGSAVWEIAGETTPPSRNDQITTSFGGSFLGEALYRMANLVLEQGYGLPPRWRDAAAAVVSPPLGFQRHARTARGSGLWASNNPAVLAKLLLGANMNAHGNVGPSLQPARNEAAADFALEYGLPGKPGYSWHRPFDYFLFRIRASQVQGVENLAVRGLLFGAPYAASDGLRGIAGLYGSYDYLSPQQFRVASTGLSLGSNVQWRLSRLLALQGHASAGIGYTSTGTVRASSAQQYNYGFTPQATVALRTIVGERVSLDLSASKFFDGKLIKRAGGNDHVFRGDAALTYKFSDNHGVTVKYITSRRRFVFPNVAESQQRLDTVGLYYTYQPGRGMGAVNW